jgi:hypothetical protein
MSDAGDIALPSRYRPVGKHRYGLTLFGLALTSIAVLVVLDQLFDESVARRVSWAAVGVIWIFQSFRAILAPQRFRENVYVGPPLRTIRFNAALTLLIWTAITAIEVQKLFVPE